MYSGLEYGKKVVVGLIMIFALLFFCGKIAYEENQVEASIVEKPEEPKKERVIDPNKPMVALTFDDGPGQYTRLLLELLETHDARASFFLVGYNVIKYPEEIRKMEKMGCDIGNHSTTHLRYTAHTPETVYNEINTTNIWIQDIIGHGATFVRPPYGAINENIQQIANAPIIMWSKDPKDWQLKDANLVRDTVLGNVQDGDIILLHDIHETTVQAMFEVIPALIERGYQLVTVSEMAKARGVDLQNTLKYYNFYK